MAFYNTPEYTILESECFIVGVYVCPCIGTNLTICFLLILKVLAIKQIRIHTIVESRGSSSGVESCHACTVDSFAMPHAVTLCVQVISLSFVSRSNPLLPKGRQL